MTAPRRLFRSQMADWIWPVGHSLMTLHIEDTVKENTEDDTAKGSSVSPGITVSDVSNQTPGDLKTEGSNSPGITVSDVSSQTPRDLKTEEQDVIMMSKKERPDGSDYNHQQDKIAMLKPETQAMKNQKEKKYLEDTEIIKEKDDLQKKTVIKETSTKVMFQYGGRLDFLTSENTMLHSKLQNEKASKERLETEVVSDNSRLSTATRDHEQSQASERELGFAFHSLRARKEWFLSSQEENMSILSRQLSKAEGKVSSLEIELSHTRDALREKTLDLESVQTDLSHIPCQKKNSEHKYENKQDKLNKYIRKQEFLENRLSQLQSENELLRQQLNTAQNKAKNELQTEREKMSYPRRKE
ncbi:ankyrin repeat domain-containing protein 26-like [Manis javanica]|uniref:ankyrin repeat domain-containing protein 26-like n=1 Tax=Manis javanica TaxID=9974 RepID=UPI003C6D3CF1